MRNIKKPRIKKEIVIGEGPNGEDIENTIDTETGDIISTITLAPLDEPGPTVSRGTTEREPIVREPATHLISAEEMRDMAIKRRHETVGKKVVEITKSILDLAEEDIFKGKHVFSIDSKEVDATILKGIVSKLRELKYTVSKKETENGVDITIKWPTKKKTSKKPSSTVTEETKTVPKKTRKRKKKPQKETESEMTFQLGKKP